jgi:hypothetical protein
MNFRKLLKYLKIVQTVSNEQRHKQGLKRLGRGYFEAHRLNPYNPLSYISLIAILIIGIIMFGFVGFWKQVDMYNPFKWN